MVYVWNVWLAAYILYVRTPIVHLSDVSFISCEMVDAKGW